MANQRGPVCLTRGATFPDEGTTALMTTPTPGICLGAPPADQEPEPPEVTANDVVRFWTYRGKPVIYEYRKGQRLYKLSYPNKEGRPYYQVGDIVLADTIDRHHAEQIFPELKDPGGSEISAFLVVMMLIGCYEEPKYKVGWKIVYIAPDGEGEGSVDMRGVIFFDNVPTALKKGDTWRYRDLTESFIYARTAADLNELQPILMGLGEFVEVVLGGEISGLAEVVGKKLLEVAGRKALLAGMEKLLGRVMLMLVTALAKCTLAFLTAAAKEFAKNMLAWRQQNKLMLQVGAAGADAPADLKPFVDKAILAGADAFALTFIKEVCEKPLLKMLDEYYEKLYPSGAGRKLTDGLKVYLAREVVKLCTTEFASSITDSLLSAWKGAIDEKGNFQQDKFEKLVIDKLKAKLEKAFTERAKKVWAGALAKELAAQSTLPKPEN